MIDETDDRDGRKHRGEDRPHHGEARQMRIVREHAALDRARDQDRDRRIERQHVVRQLGDDELEHDPARHDPGEQEARRRLAPLAPHRGRRDRGERRRGPEGEPEQQQVIAGRRAVRFLALEDLGEQILPDRLLQEAVPCPRHDGDEPRQHQDQHPEDADERTQPQQPARRAVRDGERQRRQPDDHQDQRTFEQNAGGERGPQNRARDPSRCRGRLDCR